MHCSGSPGFILLWGCHEAGMATFVGIALFKKKKKQTIFFSFLQCNQQTGT